MKNLFYWLLLALLLAYGISCKKIYSAERESPGLIVIPGLGRADRLKNVVSNLKLLEFFLTTRHWHCVVYTYVSRLDRTFWGMESELSFLQKWCSIIENPGGKVTENMYWVQPALIRKGYGKVFLLLDDIKLQASPGSNWFPLDKLIQVMESNNLTVASPLVRELYFSL